MTSFRSLITERKTRQNLKGDLSNRPVSICALIYNNEEYIEDALKSLFIWDDALTNRTAKIIREYEVCQPKLIKPIYQAKGKSIFKGPVKVSIGFYKMISHKNLGCIISTVMLGTGLAVHGFSRRKRVG